MLWVRFRLPVRKNFFTKVVVAPWRRLPRKVVESPCPEIFKRHVDDVLTGVHGLVVCFAILG